MDKFDTIAAFVAVVEHAGFAPAARALGISPSAATRLVGALEQRLSVRLLNRTTRAVSLTDAGARFLERSRRILADLDEAEQMAQSERVDPAGRIAVAAPLVFGRMHVAPLLCTFMRAHPKVEVELLLGDRNVNIVEEGIDLAVRIGDLADSSAIVRKAGMVRRVLVAAPEYLARAGTPATPDDIARHRAIAFTVLTPARLWTFAAGREIEIAPTYITNSADAAIWHALQGGGLTLALSYQVMEAVRAGALRILLPECEPPLLPVQFVYANSRLLSAKVRALIDLAAETCDWDFTGFWE